VYLAVTSLILASLTRISAISFAVPLVLFSLFKADKRGKLILVILISLAAGWLLFLAFPNTEAVLWNLFGHHIGQWGNLSTGEKISEIVTTRIPSLVYWFPGIVILILVILVTAPKRLLTFAREKPLLPLTALGIAFFTAAHFLTGGWHPDYLVPVIFVLLILCGIAWAAIYPHQNKNKKMLLKVILGTTFILNIIGGGLFFIDLSP
jgi:hypothetical protein